MKSFKFSFISILAFSFLSATTFAAKTPIKAIYIPLADHYAGIIAYEKYRDKMTKADFSITRMKSWGLLRAYFREDEVDMAFVMSPLAMDIFHETKNVRWVSQMHRDGNALAINDLLRKHVKLPAKRINRKPTADVAKAYSIAKKEIGRPTQVGVPALLATHMVVLYKYLKDHGKTLGIGQGTTHDVVAIAVAPPKAPAFIKKQNSRGIPASFEQSLPWADVVETGGFGHVAWYSKDVLPWPKGHVECIALAKNAAIKNKTAALKEVIHYIHQAGVDIENARRKGGAAMIEIARMVRKHIPEHNQEAIIQSLRPDLNVINYYNLNVEKAGMKYIMDLAVEGGILKQAIDLNAFTTNQFASKITLHK